MKLGSILVFAPDLAEAEAFYRDTLGLALRHSTPRQLVFDLSGVDLHVIRCEAPAPESHRHAATAATVCVFEVPSLAAEMRRLRALGVAFLHRTAATNPLTGELYAAFRAPGGNVHELSERRSRIVGAPC